MPSSESSTGYDLRRLDAHHLQRWLFVFADPARCATDDPVDCGLGADCEVAAMKLIDALTLATAWQLGTLVIEPEDAELVKKVRQTIKSTAKGIRRIEI